MTGDAQFDLLALLSSEQSPLPVDPSHLLASLDELTSCVGAAVDLGDGAELLFQRGDVGLVDERMMGGWLFEGSWASGTVPLPAPSLGTRCLLPAGHPLAASGEVAADALEPYPFVLLNEAHCLSENVASYCRREAVQPVTVERLSQIATVQELVALGHGISILPEMARRLDHDGRRVYRSLSGERPTRTEAMLSNPYRYRSKWTEAMRQHLRRAGPHTGSKKGLDDCGAMPVFRQGGGPGLEQAPVPARQRRREAGSVRISPARRSQTAKSSRVKTSNRPKIS